MTRELFIYNTIDRKKEKFEPLKPSFVGIYVCGPTVYGDPHLGHARPAITFDLLFRYLKHLGYRVRYVRNITDVGHLENDADEGEDKIAKKARVESLEPMEVAQYYINRYHYAMNLLNNLEPSIEPMASGHIIEQQAMIQTLLDKGFAYLSKGSVYFDVERYNRDHHYGKLSGRVLEDLISNTRELDGQAEKHNSFDFALWKKADPQHIMHWPSAWSVGFPGWHLECSVMSTKYLGEVFDIHGGGMDLLFPHHECEIAQSVASFGHETVHYWMHNNMVTINGQKMGKSLGNSVNLEEFFTGDHKLLEKAYSPMTIRFFMLQAHYRSTLDFSNDALQAAEKGMERLISGRKLLNKLVPLDKSSYDICRLREQCYAAISDDLNSPILIASLFEGVKVINLVADGKESFTSADIEAMQDLYKVFMEDILGLKIEAESQENTHIAGSLVELLLSIRKEAKLKKDFHTSDFVRNELLKLGIEVKDTKDGAEWKLK